MSEFIGKILSGRYRVDAFLGKGGMAEVYKVWDQRRSVHLAMKILHEDLAEDKVFLRRFRREAQTLEKLQHPHIVRFYGMEREDDLVFILMEYVEGTTLRKEIFKTDLPFTLDDIAHILRPVCSALHYAHESGFIHCDIKPANIMIHNNGTVLVADFGIARLTESATMTMTGAGTPAYMAPEQARGENPVIETDIYALGVILFELVTGGERPFTGEHARTTGSTSEKIRWEQSNLRPPSPRTYNPGLSPGLSKLILKCLNKDPQKRYGSALDLLQAFEQCRINTDSPALAPQKEISTGRIPDLPTVSVSTESELSGAPIVHPPPPVEAGTVGAKSQTSKEVAPLTGNILFQDLARMLSKYRWFITAAVTGLIIFLLAVLSGGGTSNTRLNVFSNSAQLYFTSNRDGKAEIYQILPSGEINRVTNLQDDTDSWAPSVDTRQIVYFTSNRDGKAEIYALADNRTIQITHTKGDAMSWEPAASNDGILYFTSNRDGKTEIYALANNRIFQVTHTAGSASSWGPTASNDGILYFTSNRDGKAEIYALADNRTIQITHTKGDAMSWTVVKNMNGWNPSTYVWFNT